METIKELRVDDLVKVTGDLTSGDQLFVITQKSDRTVSLTPVTGWSLIKRGVNLLTRRKQ